MLRFEFDGKRYQVAMAAYEQGKSILLPNGLLLRASKWLQSYPPMPGELQQVPNPFQHLPIAEAATRLNACIAEEVG